MSSTRESASMPAALSGVGLDAGQLLQRRQAGHADSPATSGMSPWGASASSRMASSACVVADRHEGVDRGLQEAPGQRATLRRRPGRPSPNRRCRVARAGRPAMALCSRQSACSGSTDDEARALRAVAVPQAGHDAGGHAAHAALQDDVRPGAGVAGGAGLARASPRRSRHSPA
jgi:hypothetical protein